MSATVTVNGQEVVSGTLSLPRQGVWGGTLLLNGTSPPDGACTLKWQGGLTLSGAAFRSGEVEGSSILGIRGGAGGLWKATRPKAYKNTPFRIPLTDILQGAGERLSAKSDGAVLARELGHWVTTEGPSANAIFALLADLDVVWRMLPEGEVWVGQDTWPNAPRFDFQVMEDDPANRTMLISADAPTLLPGQKFLGRKVSYLEHKIDATAMRTKLWMEDG